MWEHMAASHSRAGKTLHVFLSPDWGPGKALPTKLAEDWKRIPQRECIANKLFLAGNSRHKAGIQFNLVSKFFLELLF
jgi:hypothetical protein